MQSCSARWLCHKKIRNSALEVLATAQVGGNKISTTLQAAVSQASTIIRDAAARAEATVQSAVAPTDFERAMKEQQEKEARRARRTAKAAAKGQTVEEYKAVKALKKEQKRAQTRIDLERKEGEAEQKALDKAERQATGPTGLAAVREAASEVAGAAMNAAHAAVTTDPVLERKKADNQTRLLGEGEMPDEVASEQQQRLTEATMALQGIARSAGLQVNSQALNHLTVEVIEAFLHLTPEALPAALKQAKVKFTDKAPQKPAGFSFGRGRGGEATEAGRGRAGCFSHRSWTLWEKQPAQSQPS